MIVPIRKQAGWMSKNDERILEFLCAGDRNRPREIRDGLNAVNGGINLRLSYVDKRLEKLEAAELVEKHQLEYRISDRGVAYLNGDFDASTVEVSPR